MRPTRARLAVQKEKRKVGRPIAYCGDPNSPDLTPAERRRILRRIANRESARRVRARRQELLEEMAGRVRQLLPAVHASRPSNPSHAWAVGRRPADSQAQPLSCSSFRTAVASRNLPRRPAV